MTDAETRLMSPEFRKVIGDFIFDIITTFPEYGFIVKKWWAGAGDEKYSFIYKHCLTVYPERFFDIIYQNDEMFSTASDVNTDFLPGINFKFLWQCEISEKTRETIWRYLQMILLSIVGGIDAAATFGDTSKLFANVDEDDFKGKLLETLENMQSFFPDKAEGLQEKDKEKDKEKLFEEAHSGAHDPEDEGIDDHLKSILGGKLGSLAREIAEETSRGMSDDMGDVTDVQGVFKKMFENPGKLMNLVKEVGDKIDSKLKSGEVDRSDLMSEATQIMSKMKDMPGMENIQDMLKKMGMGSGSGAGANTSDFDIASLFGKKTETPAAAERKMKNTQMRERLKKKMEDGNRAKLVERLTEGIQKPLSDEQLVSMFTEKPSKGSKKKQ